MPIGCHVYANRDGLGQDIRQPITLKKWLQSGFLEPRILPRPVYTLWEKVLIFLSIEPPTEGVPADSSGMLSQGTQIARIEMGGVEYAVCSNFYCAFAKRIVNEGDIVAPGGLLFELAADGEEIPYGRSYCVLQPGASR